MNGESAPPQPGGVLLSNDYRYYYQYREYRLSVCPLVIHGLLHVIDGIRLCGPIWVTWTFYMERFCGILKSALRSRKRPFANLNARIMRSSCISLLRLLYDVDEELGIKPFKELKEGERVYPECKLCSTYISVTTLTLDSPPQHLAQTLHTLL